MLLRLLKAIIVLILLAVVYSYVQTQGWLPKVFPPLSWPTWLRLPAKNGEEIKFSQEDLEKLGAEGTAQVKILAERAKTAGSITQEFLSENVKIDHGGDKNLSEKAFEYGRYLYCQEVIKQFETQRDSE